MNIQFNLYKALEYSWKTLWDNHLKHRAEVGPDGFRYSETFYLTASDIENMVRACAQATYDNKAWPTVNYGYGLGQHGFKFRGNLRSKVRDWLFNEVRQGRLTYHNFGKGHISGARFRPAGEPPGPAEAKTIARKEKQRRDPKPRIRHYNAKGYNGHPLCTAKRRRRFSRPNHHIWCDSDMGKVTCPRCLKALNYAPVETRQEADPDVTNSM